MNAPAIPPAPAPIKARSKTERFLNRALTCGGPRVEGFSQFGKMGFCGFSILGAREMEVEANFKVGLGFVAVGLWGSHMRRVWLRLVKSELKEGRE